MESANQCQRLTKAFVARKSAKFGKVEDQKPEVQMHCITEHPGFLFNCLDVWVLETVYYTFHQQHGSDNRTGHEYVNFVYTITLPFVCE